MQSLSLVSVWNKFYAVLVPISLVKITKLDLKFRKRNPDNLLVSREKKISCDMFLGVIYLLENFKYGVIYLWRRQRSWDGGRKILANFTDCCRWLLMFGDGGSKCSTFFVNNGINTYKILLLVKFKFKSAIKHTLTLCWQC